MILPKHFLFGLSGTGIAAGGLTAGWFLIEENSYKTPNSTIPKDDIKVETQLWDRVEVKGGCGSDVWGGSDWDTNKKNEKELNWDNYRTCLVKHINK